MNAYDIAVVLEEVEMTPPLLLKILRWTRCPARWAGVACTALAGHFQVEFMRLGRRVQMLIHQLPGRLYANPKQQNIVAVHAVALGLSMHRRMPQHVG